MFGWCDRSRRAFGAELRELAAAAVHARLHWQFDGARCSAHACLCSSLCSRPLLSARQCFPDTVPARLLQCCHAGCLRGYVLHLPSWDRLHCGLHRTDAVSTGNVVASRQNRSPFTSISPSYDLNTPF